jgi:hypothetical protein
MVRHDNVHLEIDGMNERGRRELKRTVASKIVSFDIALRFVVQNPSVEARLDGWINEQAAKDAGKC